MIWRVFRVDATWLALGLGALALALVAICRGAEYDEGYTLLLTAGHRLPAWPAGVFHAAEGQALFRGAPSAAQIAAELRAQDVHPPVYFWLEAVWRAVAGPSLLAARALSVALSVAALAGVAAIARTLAIPPWRALLLCAGCYAFTYTGAIARDFALAQALGVWAVWLAVRGRGTWTAALAGVAFGLAILANYLAAFIAVGCGVWLLAARNLRVVSFATGLAMLLPVQVWFFLAQRGSRAGQFAPLEWHSALLRLLRFQGAALFGGLPLYAGAWGVAVTVGLGVLAVGAAACAFTASTPRPTVTATPHAPAYNGSPPNNAAPWKRSSRSRALCHSSGANCPARDPRCARKNHTCTGNSIARPVANETTRRLRAASSHTPHPTAMNAAR